MISLRSFFETIQTAVLSANDALVQKNLEILDQYFEKDRDMEEVQEKLDNALDAARDLGPDSEKPTRAKVNKAISAIKDLRSVLEAETSSADLLAESELNPKTVTMTFPSTDAEGKVTQTRVDVPLITLIPISFPKIDELKLKARMELHQVDDEVHVRLGKFSPSAGGNDAAQEANEDSGGVKNSFGSIEITLKPQQAPDGTQQIIDAYEKVLKAQLPN